MVRAVRQQQSGCLHIAGHRLIPAPRNLIQQRKRARSLCHLGGAHAPAAPTPDREIDCLNVVRAEAVGSPQAGTVYRVNVCATFKEQFDNAACPSDHRTMERRASRMIPTIHEVGVRIQKFTNPSKVAGLSSQMNRVILTCLSRRGPTLSIASPLESCRDGIMAAFACHSDQAVAIIPVPFRVRSCIEQHLNNLGMSFADREVNRRRIEIAASAQRRIAVQKPT